MEMREQLKTVEMDKEQLHKQFDENKMHMVTLQNKWNEAKRIQRELQMKRRRAEEEHESGNDSEQNEHLLRMLRVEYSRALADDRVFSSKQEQLSQVMHQLSTQLRNISHSSRMMDARVKAREQILSDIRLQLRNQLIANRQMMEIATSSHRLHSFIRSNVDPSSIRESAEMLLNIIKENQPILIEKTLVDEIQNVTEEILDRYNNNNN